MGVTGRWYDVARFSMKIGMAILGIVVMSGTLGRKRRVAHLSCTLAYRVAIWLRRASPTVFSRVTMLMEAGENTIRGHVRFSQTSIRLRFGLRLSRRPLQRRRRRPIYCSGDAEIIQHMQHWLRVGYIFASTRRSEWLHLRCLRRIVQPKSAIRATQGLPSRGQLESNA
jgi:hypothetical protein